LGQTGRVRKPAAVSKGGIVAAQSRKAAAHMNTDHIRSEIEQMRRQILRQRKEIRYLQRAGIHTKSAEELLERMLANVDGLCAKRDRQVGEQRRKYSGTDKVINGPTERRFR
jgi:hypothetical protein